MAQVSQEDRGREVGSWAIKEGWQLEKGGEEAPGGQLVGKQGWHKEGGLEGGRELDSGSMTQRKVGFQAKIKLPVVPPFLSL